MRRLEIRSASLERLYMKNKILFIILLSLTATAFVPALELEYEIHVYPTGKIRESRKKEVLWGVALNGGGALGFAHLGVLKAFAEEDLCPDMITGTSMGAIMGGFIAAGYEIDEVIELMQTTDFTDLFLYSPQRKYLDLNAKRENDIFIGAVSIGKNGIAVPESLLPGFGVQKLLFTYLSTVSAIEGLSDFDRLYCPFRAGSADLKTGVGYVWAAGDLGLAVRASMNIPGVFPPLYHNEMVLVDGGIYHNFPAEELKDMGADFVTGIKFASSDKDKRGIVNTVSTVISNFINEKEKEAEPYADLIIRVPLDGYNSASFNKYQDIYDKGYEEGRKYAGKLKNRLRLKKKKYFVSSIRCSEEIEIHEYMTEDEMYELAESLLPMDNVYSYRTALENGVLSVKEIKRIDAVRIYSPDRSVFYDTDDVDEVKSLLGLLRDNSLARGERGLNIQKSRYSGGKLEISTSLVRIDDIEVVHNSYMSQKRIKNIMGFKGGQILDKGFFDALDVLYGTGKFKSLIPYFVKRGEKTVCMLNVTEQEPVILRITGNYRSDKGLHTFMSITYNDFLKWGDKTGVRLGLSRDMDFQAFSGNSSLWGTPLGVWLYYMYREKTYFPRDGYVEKRHTAGFSLSLARYFAGLSLFVEKRVYDAFEGGASEYFAAGVRHSLDTLNDLYIPTEGVRLNTVYEQDLSGAGLRKLSVDGEASISPLPFFSLRCKGFYGDVFSDSVSTNEKIYHENLFDNDNSAYYDRIYDLRGEIKFTGMRKIAVPFAYAGRTGAGFGGDLKTYYGAGIEQKLTLLKYIRWEYIFAEDEHEINFFIGAKIR